MEWLLQYESGGEVLHGQFGWLVSALDWMATIIDLAAIAILLVGAIRFIIGVTVAEVARQDLERVSLTNRERIELGRYILAGLELFIVSDIIHTVLTREFVDLIYLGLLVVIRAIISYFLDRELKDLKKELEE